MSDVRDADNADPVAAEIGRLRAMSDGHNGEANMELHELQQQQSEQEWWRQRYFAERERADKLLAFKNWVHAYLDGKDIPADPGGPHSAEGCRIGDRMDLVFSQLRRLAELCGCLEPGDRCPACGSKEIVRTTPGVAGPTGWGGRCKSCKHCWGMPEISTEAK